MDPLTMILLYIFCALFVAALPSYLPRRLVVARAPARVCGACRGRGFVYASS